MRQNERLWPPPALWAVPRAHRLFSSKPSSAQLGRDRGSPRQVAPAPQLALIALVAVAVLMFKNDRRFLFEEHLSVHEQGALRHPGGMLHGATPTLLLALGIAASEFLLHYHIDWLKKQITHRNGWTAQDRCFWFALGTDQLVHGLTYVVIVAVLIAYAGLT